MRESSGSVLISGGSDIQAALGSGMIDCGFGLVGKFIQPIENGLNMVITSGMHTGCTKLLVRADSGIESVADLEELQLQAPWQVPRR